MLYLKTVRSGEDNVIAVSPIGDYYTLHKRGSSLFDYKVEEGDIDPAEHFAIITYDDEHGFCSKPLANGGDIQHFIIHENGSTFQRLK